MKVDICRERIWQLQKKLGCFREKKDRNLKLFLRRKLLKPVEWEEPAWTKAWKHARPKKPLIPTLIGVRKWIGPVGWPLHMVSGSEVSMHLIANIVFI